MAGEKVALQLVDPEQVLYSDDCDMVVLPGAEGDFGVLPLHAPVLSGLRPGVISVYQGQEVAERFFVAGGFAEVNEKGCIVLAEDASRLADLDAGAARTAIEEANKLIGEADEAEARHRRQIEVNEARLEALQAG